MSRMSLEEAHSIVADGRAYTREHFPLEDRKTYVGHTPVAVYNEAVDRLVDGVTEATHENNELRTALCVMLERLQGVVLPDLEEARAFAWKALEHRYEAKVSGESDSTTL